MPVMNGPDACDKIRHDLGSTSVIVGITGNVMPNDVALFRSKGANGVLPKPFQMKDLEALWESMEYGADT